MSNSLFIQADEIKGNTWRSWRVCLSAGLFFLYVFFQLNVFDVINQSLRSDFHINAAALSWMSSAFVWANVLFLLPAGIILDRYSARWVIRLALSTCILGTMGFALTTSFAWATFFHALTGASNAFCFLSCVVLVTRWFLPQKRAFVIGCVVTMAFIGGMLAHTPLAYLNVIYGWRNAVLIDSVVGMLILLIIIRFVEDYPNIIQSKKQTTSSVHGWQDLKAVLSNRQTWCAGLYTACLNLPIMVLCALWGASYLQNVHQLTSIDASKVISLIFLGSIVGCPLMGGLSDWMNSRKPLMIAGALATICLAIPMVIIYPLPIQVLYILFFALGVVTSAQVISYPLIAESNPERYTGLATSIASIIIMGGGGIGQVMFGFLMENHLHTQGVSGSIADFQAAMWMFPIAALVALVVMFLARETHCRSVGEE